MLCPRPDSSVGGRASGKLGSISSGFQPACPSGLSPVGCSVALVGDTSSGKGRGSGCPPPAGLSGGAAEGAGGAAFYFS